MADAVKIDPAREVRLRAVEEAAEKAGVVCVLVGWSRGRVGGSMCVSLLLCVMGL